jgi:nucleoside-diphosphate-sugar epimerase
MNSDPVLVTGGIGFVAIHSIAALLRRGYRVRSTVRDWLPVRINQAYPNVRLIFTGKFKSFAPRQPVKFLSNRTSIGVS